MPEESTEQPSANRLQGMIAWAMIVLAGIIGVNGTIRPEFCLLLYLGWTLGWILFQILGHMHPVTCLGVGVVASLVMWIGLALGPRLFGEDEILYIVYTALMIISTALGVLASLIRWSIQKAKKQRQQIRGFEVLPVAVDGREKPTQAGDYSGMQDITHQQ